MGIKFNKIVHRSPSKRGLGYIDSKSVRNAKLVRDAELARELALRDAYLLGIVG